MGQFTPSGGVAQTVTEHWNGKIWTVVARPDAGTQNNHLSGVTAISATDVWAVGDFQTSTGSGTVFQTLTEHWDGTAWSIVPQPWWCRPGGRAQRRRRGIQQ